MNDLRSKLEDIVELKREYGIGTINAWRYLKITEDYRLLRDQLTEELKIPLSLRTISKLCEHSKYTTETALQVAVCKKALPKTEELNAYVYSNYIGIFPYSAHLEEICAHDFHFKFNYGVFLIELFKNFNNCADMNNAFRKTFVDLVIDGKPIFEYENGKKIDYKQISDDEDLLLTKGGYESLEITQDFINDDQEAVEDFSNWVNNGIDNYGMYTLNNIDGPMIEERVYLYCTLNKERLYHRAIKEKTLRKLEIERRIILNEFLDYESPYFEHLKDLDPL